MKTKLTLSIIGIINILQALGYTIFAETASSMMFNTGDEAQQLAVLFQYAITPAFLMIGLMQFLSRNLSSSRRKKYFISSNNCLFTFIFCLLYYDEFTFNKHGDTRFCN